MYGYTKTENKHPKKTQFQECICGHSRQTNTIATKTQPINTETKLVLWELVNRTHSCRSRSVSIYAWLIASTNEITDAHTEIPISIVLTWVFRNSPIPGFKERSWRFVGKSFCVDCNNGTCGVPLKTNNGELKLAACHLQDAAFNDIFC